MEVQFLNLVNYVFAYTNISDDKTKILRKLSQFNCFS